MTTAHAVQEIAREKAGIFKKGVPAFTVQQPVDALQALLVSAPTSVVPSRLFLAMLNMTSHELV